MRSQVSRITMKIKYRIIVLSMLLLVIALVACSPPGNNTDSAEPTTFATPLPPPTPSKEELLSILSHYDEGWLLSERTVYRLQEFCAYTEECETTHLWLGGYGYDWSSYSTVVTADKITVEGVFIAHVSYSDWNEKCPDGQHRLSANYNTSGQGVRNQVGETIPAFCIVFID